MNVLKPDKINTIITISNNGVSQREICRRTAIDRKTIRRYLLQNDQIPQIDLNSKSSTPATSFEAKINQNPPPWPPALRVKLLIILPLYHRLKTDQK